VKKQPAEEQPPLMPADPTPRLTDRSILAALTDALDRRIQEKAKEGPPRAPTSIRELTLVPRG
jgi:hypothetical protein